MHTAIKPKSKLLQKYIIHYNNLLHENVEDLNYFVFPNTGCTLVFNQGIKIVNSEYASYATANRDAVDSILLMGKYTTPVFLSFRGFINQFSINFHPNGINHFFNKPYKVLAPNNFQIILSDEFKTFYKDIYATPNYNERVDIADVFFEKRLRETENDYLQKAIDLLHDDETISIDYITKQCNVSNRTLRRVFNLYLGCSPRSFKKILRFRNAIESKFFQDPTNFTRLAHESNFYDSSHFVKEFKALKNQTPSEFFKSISEVSDFKFPFKFL